MTKTFWLAIGTSVMGGISVAAVLRNLVDTAVVGTVITIVSLCLFIHLEIDNLKEKSAKAEATS